MSQENVDRFVKCQEAFNRLIADSPDVKAGLKFLQCMDPEVRYVEIVRRVSHALPRGARLLADAGVRL